MLAVKIESMSYDILFVLRKNNNNKNKNNNNICHRAPALASLTSLSVSRSTSTPSDNTTADDDDDDYDTPLTANEMASMESARLASATPPISLTTSDDPVSKFRKLKDIMWIREAVEDVTAAEFACSVEGSSEGEKDASLRRKRKRAVDYEKMLSNLDRRVQDMIPGFIGADDDVGDEIGKLDKNKGMGRFAYTPEQRAELLRQVIKTRRGLVEIIKGHREEEAEEAMDEEEGGFGFELPEIPELRVDIPKEDDAAGSAGPKLYVRDDGTVDWEGTLQDRAALRQFGGAVWARINGQIPDELPDEEDDSVGASKTGSQSHGGKTAVTAKIEETPAIRNAREELTRLQEELKRETRAHKKLLSSGILEGQAVANVRLASLDPELRNKIRLSAEELHLKEKEVSYQSLVYDLERIYTYLSTELGNPSTKGYVPLQDRLNVAEYGLLEGQVENCSRELNEKGSLDADILAVITEQMTDFKRRLGVDYYVTGLTYDKEAIQIWLSDILRKTKDGLMFYVKGCKLFWNDLVYCSSLIARAAQGYTLKPREVRTLRRTFKDIITFIPVVIILIIPLSPVGHVLVFGAIQRFFPDFFPSCFTEQRQNLLQLYETTEYSEFTINESIQERFTRFLEAGVYLVASKSQELYTSISTPSTDDDSDQSDGRKS
mmetsp:Transcript_23516/g.66950  ORF Transcript_23516/g.66950 Transcript_23516/m.66950 type:complete len:662 (+) Transcript_23516:8-1993(+)